MRAPILWLSALSCALAADDDFDQMSSSSTQTVLLSPTSSSDPVATSSTTTTQTLLMAPSSSDPSTTTTTYTASPSSSSSPAGSVSTFYETYTGTLSANSSASSPQTPTLVPISTSISYRTHTIMNTGSDTVHVIQSPLATFNVTMPLPPTVTVVRTTTEVTMIPVQPTCPYARPRMMQLTLTAGDKVSVITMPSPEPQVTNFPVWWFEEPKDEKCGKGLGGDVLPQAHKIEAAAQVPADGVFPWYPFPSPPPTAQQLNDAFLGYCLANPSEPRCADLIKQFNDKKSPNTKPPPALTEKQLYEKVLGYCMAQHSPFPEGCKDVIREYNDPGSTKTNASHILEHAVMGPDPVASVNDLEDGLKSFICENYPFVQGCGSQEPTTTVQMHALPPHTKRSDEDPDRKKSRKYPTVTTILSRSTASPYSIPDEWFSRTLTSLPATTTAVNGTTVVYEKNYDFDFASAARQSPMPTPPICGKKHMNSTERHRCRYEKCLLRHWQPLNITTAYQGIAWDYNDMMSPKCARAWITQWTSLSNTVHWGTTENGGLYYPHTMTTTLDRSGTQHVKATPKVPGKFVYDQTRAMMPHAPPTCWDKRTCCKECELEAKRLGHFDMARLKDPRSWPLWLMVLGIILLALLALFLLLCCLPMCMRRLRSRKDKKQSNKQEALAAAANAGGAPEVIVTSAGGGGGGAGSGAGHGAGGVDPLLAAVGGAAAGAALAHHENEKAHGDDGKGTMGRRAEEGRGGNVKFADPEKKVAETAAVAGVVGATGAAAAADHHDKEKDKAAADKGAASASGGNPKVVVVTNPDGTVTTVPAHEADAASKPGSAPAEKTVVVKPAGDGHAHTAVGSEHDKPVAVHDGAYDGPSEGRPTGIETVDMGSMRGRKRTKGHGHLMNIKF